MPPFFPPSAHTWGFSSSFWPQNRGARPGQPCSWPHSLSSPSPESRPAGLYGPLLWAGNGNPLSSVQFSHSVMSDTLRPHGLQHARPPCPSPTPRVYSNSYPLSQWCHPTISSSVVSFFSRFQSFPAPGSFPMSQFFTSGGQRIGFQLQHQSFQWIFRTDFL